MSNGTTNALRVVVAQPRPQSPVSLPKPITQFPELCQSSCLVLLRMMWALPCTPFPISKSSWRYPASVFVFSSSIGRQFA